MKDEADNVAIEEFGGLKPSEIGIYKINTIFVTCFADKTYILSNR